VLLILLLVSAAAASATAQDQVVAIKAGKVLPVSGEPIDKGVILIKGGKIAGIGPNLTIPEGATVIDAASGVAMPGLVDARGVRPIRGEINEQSDEITPAFHVSLAVDPKSKLLKHSLQGGVTTLYVSPGGENVISGLGAVLKPVGKTAAEMIVKDDAALHITMGSDSTYGNEIPWYNRPTNFYYRRPGTTMAVAWMLRKSFSDAQKYAEAHKQADPAMEVLAAALKGGIPIRMAARRAIDIRTAFRIADEYGLKIILDECTEGYKVPELIASKQTTVVLGPFYYYPHTFNQYSEGRECNWNNAGILAKAGVKVVLSCGADPDAADLLTAATFAVRNGMPADLAIKAITVTPAELLGVADRVGTLAEGKDADILILSGEPLASTSRVQRVLVNGRTVYQAEQ
jgi:imidazolonepropionase-like amidohydrolase